MLIYSEMSPHRATNPPGSSHRPERAPNRFAARKERKTTEAKKREQREGGEKVVFSKKL